MLRNSCASSALSNLHSLLRDLLMVCMSRRVRCTALHCSIPIRLSGSGLLNQPAHMTYIASYIGLLHREPQSDSTRELQLSCGGSVFKASISASVRSCRSATSARSNPNGSNPSSTLRLYILYS